MAEQPQSGDGLVMPEAFPCRSDNIDVESIKAGSGKLKSMGQSIDSHMDNVVGYWNGMPGVYQAPEGEQVHALMKPAATASETIKEKFESASKALDTFADEVGPVKVELAALEKEATAFRQEALAGYDGKPWKEHQPAVDRNTELLGRYAKIVERLTTASATCANAINGLLDGVCVATVEGVSADALMQSGEMMPWGAPVSRNRNCGESVLHGAGGFLKNTWDGATGLAGFGPNGWSASTLKNSWVGTGDFLFSTAVLCSPVSHAAKLFGNEKVNSWIDRRHDVAKSGLTGMVGYDYAAHKNGKDGWHKWKEDGVAAFTESALNVGTFFIPGPGTGGAVAKTAALGAKTGGIAAKGVGFATKCADFAIPGGGWLVKGGTKLVDLGSNTLRGAEIPHLIPKGKPLLPAEETALAAKTGPLTPSPYEIPRSEASAPNLGETREPALLREPALVGAPAQSRGPAPFEMRDRSLLDAEPPLTPNETGNGTPTTPEAHQARAGVGDDLPHMRHGGGSTPRDGGTGFPTGHHGDNPASHGDTPEGGYVGHGPENGDPSQPLSSSHTPGSRDAFSPRHALEENTPNDHERGGKTSGNHLSEETGEVAKQSKKAESTHGPDDDAQLVESHDVSTSHSQTNERAGTEFARETDNDPRRTDEHIEDPHSQENNQSPEEVSPERGSAKSKVHQPDGKPTFDENGKPLYDENGNPREADRGDDRLHYASDPEGTYRDKGTDHKLQYYTDNPENHARGYAKSEDDPYHSGPRPVDHRRLGYKSPAHQYGWEYPLFEWRSHSNAALYKEILRRKAESIYETWREDLQGTRGVSFTEERKRLEIEISNEKTLSIDLSNIKDKDGKINLQRIKDALQETLSDLKSNANLADAKQQFSTAATKVEDILTKLGDAQKIDEKQLLADLGYENASAITQIAEWIGDQAGDNISMDNSPNYLKDRYPEIWPPEPLPLAEGKVIERLPLLGKQDFYLSPRHLDIIGSGKLDRLDIEELLSSERKPRRFFRLVVGENKGGDNPSFGNRTIANGEKAEQGSWPYAVDLLTGKNQDPRLQTAIADTEHPTMTVPSNEELAPRIKDRLVSRELNHETSPRIPKEYKNLWEWRQGLLEANPDLARRAETDRKLLFRGYMETRAAFFQQLKEDWVEVIYETTNARTDGKVVVREFDLGGRLFIKLDEEGNLISKFVPA